MIIVEKFCHSYFKLWALEDQVKNKSQLGIQKESTKELLKENTKEVAAEAGKDPLTKKSD
jgi:hypothetical protein